jgi:hypothetical protein
MIRNLMVLIAAAMVVAACGAISASGVQAAEGHCGVEPCMITVKADGTPGPTGKTGTTCSYSDKAEPVSQ